MPRVLIIVQAQQEIIISSKVTLLDWFPETLETPLNTPLKCVSGHLPTCTLLGLNGSEVTPPKLQW